MSYPSKKENLFDIVSNIMGAFCILMIIAIIILAIFTLNFDQIKPNKIENSEQWGGYSPIEIYTVFDKDTGVYYAITERGDICPMYTIEGEVKLVDQGNEYVVHRNLGEPYAQE